MKKIFTLVVMLLALNVFFYPNASAASLADNSVGQSAKVQDVKSMAGHGNLAIDSTKQGRRDTVKHSVVNPTEPAAPGGVQTPAENQTWLYVTVILALIGGVYFAFARLRKK